MSTPISEEIFEKLVTPRAYLWWWVPDKNSLSLESVVEGILSGGDMEEVHLLLALAGRSAVKDIFLRQISRKRCNYRPQTMNFFSKVFQDDI